MRIGIIGATGLIGHHAALAAAAFGHEVVVIHRPESRLDRLRGLRYTSRIADLNHPIVLSAALHGLDGVVHAAAHYPIEPKPWRQELAFVEQQMEGFVEACIRAEVPRVLFVSGAAALPKDPHGAPADETSVYAEEPEDKTPYILVKWLMEKIARERAAQGVPIVIAMPAMALGDLDYRPSSGKLLVEIANGALPAYIQGQSRNVGYAGDLGRGLILALEKGGVGERYLIGGSNITMDELVRLIAQRAEVAEPKAVPLAVAKAAAKEQELRYHMLGGHLPTWSSVTIATMSMGQFLSGEKAERELNYRPQISVAEAIDLAYRWFAAQGYIHRERGRAV